MRALQCHQTGGFDELAVEDVAEPTPGPGEVLVAVAAASVNFVDTLVVAGRYQIPFAPPFTPGSDFAGTVAAVGSDVKGLAVGDRVHGMSRLGAFAELVAVHHLEVRKTGGPTARVRPPPHGADRPPAARRPPAPRPPCQGPVPANVAGPILRRIPDCVAGRPHTGHVVAWLAAHERPAARRPRRTRPARSPSSRPRTHPAIG